MANNWSDSPEPSTSFSPGDSIPLVREGREDDLGAIIPIPPADPTPPGMPPNAHHRIEGADVLWNLGARGLRSPMNRALAAGIIIFAFSLLPFASSLGLRVFGASSAAKPKWLNLALAAVGFVPVALALRAARVRVFVRTRGRLLVFERERLLGGKSRRAFPIADIAELHRWVESYEDGDDHAFLRLTLKDGRQNWLLSGRSPEEIAWVAWELRKRLDVRSDENRQGSP